MGWENVQLIRVDHDGEQWQTPVDTVTNFQVPYREGNFLSCCGSSSFSRHTLPHRVSLTVFSNKGARIAYSG